jgi:hypothetical protein
MLMSCSLLVSRPSTTVLDMKTTVLALALVLASACDSQPTQDNESVVDAPAADSPAPPGADPDATTSPHLPGGKKYFVFAVGGLTGASSDEVKVANVTFWASLDGHYYGAAARRLTWSGWYWKANATSGHAGYSGAVSVGTKVSTDCKQTGIDRYSPDGSLFNNNKSHQEPSIGELRAASSYTGGATESKQGDFYVVTSSTPNYVHIRWDNGTWEDWNITTASNGIQKLQWRNSNLGYNQGVAAGSNTSLATRVHPTVAAEHGNLGFLPLETMSQCTAATWVMNESHYDSDASSPCSCSPKRSYINNWLARIGTADRRDLWHSWCECLAFDSAWYDGGSHQRMMLQAIDDSGKFRGYVGVEADNDFSHAALYNYLDF